MILIDRPKAQRPNLLLPVNIKQVSENVGTEPFKGPSFFIKVIEIFVYLCSIYLILHKTS